MPIDLDVQFFNNIDELILYINNKIEELNRRIKELKEAMNKLQEKVSKYEVFRKIVKEITGQEAMPLTSHIEISGLKLIIDPRPFEEYELIQEVCNALMDKVTILRKILHVLEYLRKSIGSEGVSAIVEFKSDIPIKIMLKV